MMSLESWSVVGVLWSCDQKKCFAFPAVLDEPAMAPTVANAATARAMPRISLRIVPSSPFEPAGETTHDPSQRLRLYCYERDRRRYINDPFDQISATIDPSG